MKEPVFIISLDFELIWGVISRIKKDTTYLTNIKNTPEVVQRSLEWFSSYGIRATWATVGYLFAENQDELEHYFPSRIQAGLPYRVAQDLINEYGEGFCFAPQLIAEIKKVRGQEIASHTFSHYHTREPGSTSEDFAKDIRAAKAIAKAKNTSLKSFVFPRNQVNKKYLPILIQEGFTAYRGNEPGWMFPSPGTSIYADTPSNKMMSIPARGARLLDTYFYLGSWRSFGKKQIAKAESIVNIPSSHFFRPYNKHLKYLENARIRRIKKAMTHAAKHKKLFHLWWHPHNFGRDIERNLSALQEILIHFNKLKDEFGMRSMNMNDTARLVLENKTVG